MSGTQFHLCSPTPGKKIIIEQSTTVDSAINYWNEPDSAYETESYACHSELQCNISIVKQSSAEYEHFILTLQWIKMSHIFSELCN